MKKEKIKDIAERAIKTYAQSLLGFLSVGLALSDIDWLHALSVATVSALISVLTNIIGGKQGEN